MQTCLKNNFFSTDKVNIGVSKDSNVDSLVDKIIGYEWGFAISREESQFPEDFENSIQNFIEVVASDLKSKGVSDSTINEIKNKLKIRILSNDVEVEESEESSAEIPDAELDTSKQITVNKLDQQLRSIFGNDEVLKNNFLRTFKHDIYAKTIINIGNSIESSSISYDVESLNNAIIKYQNTQHKIIYEFLKSKNLLPEGERVANLFNDTGEINLKYSKNMNAFQQFLDSQPDLQKLVSTQKDILEAVQAFLTLQYFDKLMLSSVGKYLYINTKQTQPIVNDDGRIKYKYSINRKNVNLASGWQNEIRDGIDEIGSFSQMIIEQIPLIGTNNYLNKTDLISSFLKLKYAISQLGDSSSIKNRIAIRNAFRNLNKNTIQGWKDILTILNNSKTDGLLQKALITASTKFGKEKMGLSDSDFMIFDSVFEYFFNKKNGIYNIERFNEFSGGRSIYGLTECLFATINSTTQANYLEFVLKQGRPTLQQKSKWNTRTRVFELRDAINNKVFRAEDLEFLNNFKFLPTGDVIYAGFHISVDKRKSLGIFDPGALTILQVQKDGRNIILDNYFKEIIQHLESESGRQDILDNKDGKYTEFINFLSEIDDKMNTNFLSQSGLQQLRIYTQQNIKNPLNSLYLSAARIAGAYYVNDKFREARVNNPDLTTFDLKKFLRTENHGIPYSSLKFINDNDQKQINKQEGGIYLLGIDRFSKVLDAISDAEAIFRGDNNKSTTKNLERNSIPNVSVTFTDIIQEFINQEQEGAPTNNLLFSGNNSKYIIDTYIDTDVQTLNGIKSVDQFTTSELLYHFLTNKFIYGMQQMGLFISQPVTYSDKKKFLNFAVNWSDVTEYKDYKDSPYKIPESVHINLIDRTQGQYYRDIYHKVANDYRLIFGINSEDDRQVFLEADRRLSKETPDSFINRAYQLGIKIYEDLHYRKIGKTLTANETLFNYANSIYANTESLTQFMRQQKIGYLNQLLDNYVIISADSVVREALNSALDKTDENASDWIEDDILVLAKDENGKNIVSGESIPLNAKIRLNPLIESYFYFHNVFDNNIKLGITGHELHHKVKAIKNVLSDFSKKTGIVATSFLDAESKIGVLPEEEQIKAREILDNSYHTIISLAHNAQFKRTVPIPGTIRPFSQNTLKGIASTYKSAVVEDLKALTHDFTGNYGFADDGSDVDAHDGSAWIDPFTSILENYSLEDSEGGEVKKPLWDVDEPQYGVRRLIKYASNTITNRIMQQSSLSSINMYNLFKKMTNEQWQEDIDLVDDWAITGGYNPNTSFGTNIINKENPLYYSHNGKYHQIINFGKEEVNGKKVYYTIEDDVDAEGLSTGNPPYKVYHLYDNESNHYRVTDTSLINPVHHSINSLFELHAAMGGLESMSLTDGRLIDSEASNRAVAHFMIYVSKPTEKYNSLEGKTSYQKGVGLTQEYFNQPLKTKLINYVINQSAIKNGASNLNSKNVFFNGDKLKYDTYSTLKYGIQQDSDHTADEGKVTEMSQVISALDANGLYHDEISELYRVLGQQSVNAAKIELDAIKSEDKNKLYDIIGKTIINNIQRDERGLTKAILYQIRKNFNLSTDHNLDSIKIPFSDPSIYGKVLQVVGSVLNKKSIKRKYPGMGQVMVPAFGIYQIWEINGQKYQYKDLLKRAIKHNESLGDSGIQDNIDPIQFNKAVVNQYLNSVAPNQVVYDGIINNMFEIDPTNVLEIYYKDSNNQDQVVQIKLDSLPDYYSFKENTINFLRDPKKYNLNVVSITRIEKNNKVPRDLAPTRVHFTYEYNGQTYKTNIYDTWPYLDMVAAMRRNDIQTVEYYKKSIIPQFLQQLERGVYALKDASNNVVPCKITEMQNQPAENIMSNVYQTRFGIKTGDELRDVTGPEYFKTSVKFLDSAVYNFDFQLITKNNQGNIYISLDQMTTDNENYQSRYVPWRVTNLIKRINNNPKDKSKVVNRVYYMDNNNVEQFEIGRDIDVSDEIYYDKNTSSYKYISTGEVVTDRKLFREGTTEDGKDRILEYVEFLLKSEIKPKNKNSFTKYNIDQAKLKRVLMSDEKLTNSISKIVHSLYLSDSFLMITPARNIKKSNYIKVKNILKKIADDTKQNDLKNYLNNVLANVFTHSKGTLLGEGFISLDSGNTVKLNEEAINLGVDVGKQFGGKVLSLLRSQVSQNPLIKENFARIQSNYNRSRISHWDNEYLNQISKKQYASFQKSLFFTSSRIPAQTLQSFMKMECVGFNGVDTNYCAVSHFQAFLQGSDY